MKKKITRKPIALLKQWSVPSASGGDPHKVALKAKDHTYICDCLGFRYRQTCRHIDTVKAGKTKRIVAAPVAKARPVHRQVVTIVTKFSKRSK